MVFHGKRHQMGEEQYHKQKEDCQKDHMEKRITAPFSREDSKKLRAGDHVLITGTIFTARDAAHKRMYEALQQKQTLPMKIEGAVFYYMGPTPARPGRVIGAAGPTTAGRMDQYTPDLLERGLVGMIGKGKRSREVKESIVRNGAVYFAALGGAGALLSKAVLRSEIVAYEDLETEAIRKLEVKDFPVIVAIDSEGNDLYEQIAYKETVCG